MMHEKDADRLRDVLQPMMPDGIEVTSVPWANEGPWDEWIVTVWHDDNVLFDVFNVGRGFICRKIGRGAELGKAYDPAGIVSLVRELPS